MSKLDSMVEKAGIVVGQRVRLVEAINRFPNFQVEAGAEGVVKEACGEIISVRMDQVIPNCAEWDNCIEWGPCNNGEEDLEEFLSSVRRVDGVRWGASVESLRSTELRHELAKAFSILLMSTLDAAEMKQIIARNRAEQEAGVCASHDFCDANMVMAEAFLEVTGAPSNPADEEHATAWSAAWKLAYAAEFCAPALVLGGTYRGEWGDDFVKAESRVEPGAFFGDGNAYEPEDMCAIAKLAVGEVWQSPDYPTHRVTRLT